MSNSGTLTSCFADFIKLPKPAFRANRSLSSWIVSIKCRSRSVLLTGEALRVGGRDRMSISIIIDDLRRNAGSRGNNGREGDGDAIDPFSAVGERPWTAVEGRANDHERTRSNAKTWQPSENRLNLEFGTQCNAYPSCRTHETSVKQSWIRLDLKFRWFLSQLAAFSIVTVRTAVPSSGRRNEVLQSPKFACWRRRRCPVEGSTNRRMDGLNCNWNKNREIRAPILCEQLGLVCVKARRPNFLAIDFRTGRRLEEWYFSEYLAWSVHHYFVRQHERWPQQVESLQVV